MSAATSFLNGTDFPHNNSFASNKDTHMDFLNSAPSSDFLNATGPANTNNPLNNTINPTSTSLDGDFGHQFASYLSEPQGNAAFSSSPSDHTASSMSASKYSSHTSATSLEAASPSDPKGQKGRMTTRSRAKRPNRSGLSLHDSITARDPSESVLSEDEVNEASPPPSKKKRAPRGGAKNPAKTQRRKSLERNRLAASKCRQKKKEWMHDLEDTKASMEKQHNNLLSEYSALVEEITELKNALVAHAGCNDPNIDGWINNEAAKYVQRVRNSQDTNGSSDRDDSVSLPTPTDADFGGLPISIHQSQKGNEAVNELDQDFMDEPMFNEDIFMMQPQEAI